MTGLFIQTIRKPLVGDVMLDIAGVTINTESLLIMAAARRAVLAPSVGLSGGS